MGEVVFPGGRVIRLEHVVFDYNGTLAEDGRMAPNVGTLLAELAAQVKVSVITADTFGTVKAQLHGMSRVELVVLPEGGGTEKMEYVQSLPKGGVVAVGNGVNDRQMFEAADLSICVLGPEGASVPSMLAADLVVRCPEDALRLLLKPQRLIATMRE